MSIPNHPVAVQLAHELGYWHDELIYVNTLCSCVCDLRRVPLRIPGFIHKIEAGDHCHLDGLCMVDSEPRCATAHAATDKKEGWRKIKNNGVLIDLTSGEVVVDGLSLPHSPRWHNGVLWLYESGTGTLGIVDLQHGTYEPVVYLAGFTTFFLVLIHYLGYRHENNSVSNKIYVSESIKHGFKTP